MVKIRLARMGRKKLPFYRILVSDARAPRNSGFIEKLGFYDPKPKQPVIQVDVDKALEWMSKGAQPTDTVRSLFSRQGIMQLFEMKSKKNATPEELVAAHQAWKAKHPERFPAVAVEPDKTEA